jgi:hypothetical protein
MKRALIGGILAALAAPALGGYWIDWEGDDWPESVGYTRFWGNWDGPYQGGAYRTLENGILTYDSLYDPGVYDFYYLQLPGQMDPGPGESLVMEWRLKVTTVNGLEDPGVTLFSDDGWAVGLGYAEDHIVSGFENLLEIPFVPYIWHEYQLVSYNMRDYALRIDGTLVRQGAFAHVFTQSQISFGEGTQGASSFHQWDYFRFGAVVPEPGAFHVLVVMWVMVWRGARRA